MDIKIAALSLSEVISEIAAAFNVSPEKTYGEDLLTILKDVGSGTIKGITFDGGLGIIQYDCLFTEDTEIQFVVTEVHPLKFLYVIGGNLHHRFANEKKVHIVERFQNAIVASADGHGHILNFKKNVKTHIFSLEIDRAVFQKKNNFQEIGMNERLKILFDDVKADEAFYYEGDYSLRMAHIFKRIADFQGSDFFHTIFMESIAYQTMVQQISQFLDDHRQENNRSVLRRREIDGILEASEYIDSHLATYKSLPILTKITGLNAAKLQEGFKYLHNTTVNEYVYQARLNHAKELLLKTDDSISEIVYEVGLSSKSYFSRVFKEEYGVQPSTFRKTRVNT